MSIFSMLFFCFFQQRGNDLATFQSSALSLDVVSGAINTVVLLTSSLMMVLALEAYRKSKFELTCRFLLFAVLLGGIFSLNKLFEYGSKLGEGITPISNDFFMYYFVLTGMHFLHVLVGMIVLAYFLLRIRRGLHSNNQLDMPGKESLEGSANYWHMVDLIWIMIFPLLYMLG
ncbi:MAG: cytochrome c oxidase subunit 3 [Deltaproteobacteria bacterium]|nr:cytochrome c oxidase subunit 3 [Deltaproteobacteria bacterium]